MSITDLMSKGYPFRPVFHVKRCHKDHKGCTKIHKSSEINFNILIDLCKSIH